MSKARQFLNDISEQKTLKDFREKRKSGNISKKDLEELIKTFLKYREKGMPLGAEVAFMGEIKDWGKELKISLDDLNKFAAKYMR